MDFVAVLFVVSVVLPLIALFSFGRLAFLRAETERIERAMPVGASEVLSAAARVAGDFFTGRSKAGLFELILLLVGFVATLGFLIGATLMSHL